MDGPFLVSNQSHWATLCLALLPGLTELTETFNRRVHHQCQNLGTLPSMAADSAVWVRAASGHRLDIIDNRYPVCGRRLDST